MRTIIVGYADANAGAESGIPLMTETGDLKLFSEEQLEKSKSFHRFPEGVEQLKKFMVTEIDNSVFIGTNIGDLLEKTEQDRVAAAEEAAKKAKVQSGASKVISDAQAKVQSTARARNELMGKLHQAESKFNAHQATPEDLREKTFDKSIAEIKKLILGDPEKKIAGLKDQVAEAIAAYDAAAAAYAELVKPLNQPQEPKSQFVDA